MKEGKDLQDEIRLMRNYNYNKLTAIQTTLDMIIQFARDDLERLDKMQKAIDKTSLSKKTSLNNACANSGEGQ